MVKYDIAQSKLNSKPWAYDEHELQSCLQCINNHLKKIKFKKLWKDLGENSELVKCFKIDDIER